MSDSYNSRMFLRAIREYLGFVKGFARRPLKTGSLVPSSRQLAEAMVAEVDFNHASLIIEVGPGTGAITQLILEKLPDCRKYMGLDLNPYFIERLRTRFPMASFYECSAEILDEKIRIKGQGKADHIVSALPWTLFSGDVQTRILESISKSLSHGGVFTTFMYVHSRYLPSGQDFLLKLFSKFKKVRVWPIVWRNFPPGVV